MFAGNLSQSIDNILGTAMVDTTHPEYVAEDLISHRLQQAGFLVAKPKNDRLGTDLLVFTEVADGVKFCRAQCKGRSVRMDTAITIPGSYVTNGFIVFLYVDSEAWDGSLYFFTPNDVRTWPKNANDEHRLGIGQTTYRAKLAPWLFGPSSVQSIRQTIALAETLGEFRTLTHSRLEATLGELTMQAQGRVAR